MNDKLKKIFLAVFLAFIISGGICILSASAQTTPPDLGLEMVKDDIGLPSTDIRLIAARIIRTALGLLGIVAVVLILYGGFTWMTAGGSEDRISKAKQILVNAVIGLVIILSAYAIASFVISSLVDATTGGNGGGGGSGGGGGGGSFTNVLYITSMPGDDLGCGSRNIHPVIVFNKPVDLATIPGNLLLRKKDDNTSANGTWHFMSPTRQNAIRFDPIGDCEIDPPLNDCLDADTTYQIYFASSGNIKSQDTTPLSLNCNAGGYKQECLNNPSVEFATGSGVDIDPPTIAIVNPFENQVFSQGQNVEVDITYTDNFGLQNLFLEVDGVEIVSKSISGCEKTGSATLSWASGIAATGTHALIVTAVDGANLSSDSSRNIRLNPSHCYDDELNFGETIAGPPACGNGCGVCGGDTCTDNEDCSSGWCENNVCVDRMRIDSFSPTKGAASTTYVSVFGQFFGEDGGALYFTKSSGGWTKAFVANCGAGIDNWTQNQIIVKVPSDATDGPLKVETKIVIGSDNAEHQFIDITDGNDNWGYNNNFDVNDDLIPGLCAIKPNSDTSYSDVILLGENFGTLRNNTSNDNVLFDSSAVLIRNWADKSVTARVPAMGNGAVSVKLENEGKYSNSIRFVIRESIDSDRPMIESITPDTGAKGEYITILGSNFGNFLGKVLFKLNGEGEAIFGSFDFPDECDGFLWDDKQIIVKFPEEASIQTNQDYTVQIQRSGDSVIGPIGDNFRLTTGDPAPGICKIEPSSGPVPFASGSSMKIYGEYYDRNSTQAVPYFWLPEASVSSIEGRIKTESESISNLTDQQIEIGPPAGSQTGPVVMYRAEDDKMSNSIPFTVYNCVENNNTCTVEGNHCCESGVDVGMCKSSNEICSGDTRSTGYMWSFSTGPFPPTVYVVERCNAQTDTGVNLPSPSPSIHWSNAGNQDHYNTCRTAKVNVEFSMTIDQSTINANNIQVYKCKNVDEKLIAGKNECEHDGTAITMTQESYDLFIAAGTEFGDSHALSMFPEIGNWEDDSWYHVVLNKDIKSTASSYVFDGEVRYLNPQNLKTTRSCDGNSAYCFIFKTDAQDCRLAKVIVTPYKYWTSILESPMQYRLFKDNSNSQDGDPLEYKGHGLSDQHCITMSMSEYSWSWNSSKSSFTDIIPVSIDGNTTTISALANTVAVGLKNPDDAAPIEATASREGNSKTGSSPLTIDLSKPKVIDYWPNCIESCLNAEIGAKFNIRMSNINLSRAVNVYKCSDENCLVAEKVSAISSIDQADNRILKIKIEAIAGLEKDTIYKVVLSRDGTSENNLNYQLWSAGSLSSVSAASKPMQNEFVWRFRTKSERCVIDRVHIIPSMYIARHINDRKVFSTEVRAAPDDCDAKGQRLNTWLFDWVWGTDIELLEEQVVHLETFSTQGQSPVCDSNCLAKGSDIPVGVIQESLCGNDTVEAGEDCDPPQAGDILVDNVTMSVASCNLNCLRPGNSFVTTTVDGKTDDNKNLCGDGWVSTLAGEECDPNDSETSAYCTDRCLWIGSEQDTQAEEIGLSICGNRNIGLGEDCDLGIYADYKISTSSLNCSQNCLHTGTKLFASWCYYNTTTYAGFSETDYLSACKSAISICGDGRYSPGEDERCEKGDGATLPDCTLNCLGKTKEVSECNPYTTTTIKNENGDNIEVITLTEGCNQFYQHTGSSLLYETPSVCGDGIVGIGEDEICESGFVITHKFTDPWVLATGVGKGELFKDTSYPYQKDIISAIGTQIVSNTTYSQVGKAKYYIVCGYHSDEECQAIDSSYGVGSNTCCYEKPVLQSTYPVKNDSNPSSDVCPNTHIEAKFNQTIDKNTLVDGKVLIARGYNMVADNITECPNDQKDVTFLVKIASSYNAEMPWYKKVWHFATDWLVDLFRGQQVRAFKELIDSDLYCTDDNIRSLDLQIEDADSQSTISIKLKNALATSSDYVVMLRPSVKSVRGVSIGDVQWKFITGDKICEVTNLEISPDKYMFSKANDSNSFIASPKAANNQIIQSVDGYDWEYVWNPIINEYITVENTVNNTNLVTSKNRNGQADLTVSINFIENIFTPESPDLSAKSEITVFLCENPWPSVSTDDFPFIESEYDFSTFYCRDSGNTGVADDLPLFKNASSDVSSSAITEHAKRYLFTNKDNKDAIGIQIFYNEEHLSVQDWFISQGFSGDFNTLKIDGYNAITDGNNYYIDALKLPNNINSNIYSNIYQISINSDATSETRQVFDQIMKNFKFNNSITNERYCGELMSSEIVNYNLPCNSDLDCFNYFDEAEKLGEISSVEYYCLNSKDKFQRNYKRLNDMRGIIGSLESIKNSGGKYPKMKDNTFLTSQALSVWTDSWTELGSNVGSGAFPVDPINKLVKSGTCFTGLNACVKDADCASLVLNNRLSYWTADDNVSDIGSLKNHGSFEGDIGTAEGKGHGNAFEFYGDSESKVIIPHHNDYNNDNITISTWIYPTKKNTATIIKKGGTDSEGISRGGFALEYSGFSFSESGTKFNNGTIRFAVFPDTTSDIKYYALDSTDPIALNKWHNIVVSYNKTTGKGMLYIDGVEKASQFRIQADSGSTSVQGNQISSVFNSDILQVGQNFNGNIDNISFYNAYLENGEVSRLYNGLCIIHDSETGWSTEDRRFSFACNPMSYAYRYINDATNNDFKLRLNFEPVENVPSNYYGTDNFVEDFLRGRADYSSGVCLSSDEVSSPYNVVCGDGILGAGEDCDPPGSVYIDTSICPLSATKRECSSSCVFNSNSIMLSCEDVISGRCGDGKVQLLRKEVCDDGLLNGQPGRCNKECNGLTDNCGNGKLDKGEFCDTVIDDCRFREGVIYNKALEQDPIFYFLIDLSGSMDWEFGSNKIAQPPKKSRLDYIKEELIKIAESFSIEGQKAKMGIGTFSSEYSVCIAQGTYNNLQDILDIQYYSGIDVRNATDGLVACGGTYTGDAINWIRTDIFENLSNEDKNRNKNLVLVTDGDESDNVKYKAVDEIKELSKNGILTYILGVAHNTDTFDQWAQAGDTGSYIPVDENDNIAEIMREISLRDLCREYSSSNGYSCNWNCTGFGGYCGDGIIQLQNGESCEADTPCTLESGASGIQSCERCVLSECNAIDPIGSEGDCGNGIIEEFEACDRSDQNGIECIDDLEYPHISCTYCSNDCRNIITQDVSGFCGDGIIQKVLREECEGDVVCTTDIEIPGGGFAAGIQKCDDNCKLSKCVSLDLFMFNTGDICGDGIIQSELGEECEGNGGMICSVFMGGPAGTKYGTKYCDYKTCKFGDCIDLQW